MSRIGEGIGLIAGAVALAVGGAAAGMELERRVVSTRLRRGADVRVEVRGAAGGDSTGGDATEDFFGLRSAGPDVITPDGVVLHTEVDQPAVDRPDHFTDQAKGRYAPTPSPTIVFVHGYALDLDCWHFQRKHFRGRHRLVFYDQRSHGRSTRSAPELCRISQLAEDLEQLLDEVVPPGPVILIGHSMGGMTILRLARTRPELFGPDAIGDHQILGVGLTFTAAGEMTDYSPIRALPGRTFGRLAPPLMAGLNRIPQLVERTRKAGSDIGFVVTKRASFGSDVPASYIEFVSEMVGRTSLGVVADFYPAFAELDETAGLHRLRSVETAVVGGLDDVILPIAHTDRIIAELPEADSRRLAACGHLGMIEHHDAVDRLLDRLVDRALRT